MCGQIPNLVKLRDAICHNFILSPRCGILGSADPPKRETLHILATPSPPISPPPVQASLPHVRDGHLWDWIGVEFHCRCDSNGAEMEVEMEARQGGRSAAAASQACHCSPLAFAFPIVFPCTPTPFLGRKIPISRGNLGRGGGLTGEGKERCIMGAMMALPSDFSNICFQSTRGASRCQKSCVSIGTTSRTTFKSGFSVSQNKQMRANWRC